VICFFCRFYLFLASLSSVCAFIIIIIGKITLYVILLERTFCIYYMLLLQRRHVRFIFYYSANTDNSIDKNMNTYFHLFIKKKIDMDKGLDIYEYKLSINKSMVFEQHHRLAPSACDAISIFLII
jgi:hypothetical protein